MTPPAANNGVTTYEYHLNGSSYLDPLGRVHSVTKIDGQVVRTDYTGTTRTTYDDEDGNATVSTVNADG